MQEHNETVEQLYKMVIPGEDEVRPILSEKEEPLSKQDRLNRWINAVDQ